MILVIMFISHFIADFLLQSRDMGKRKSQEFTILLNHLGIQFVIMYLGLLIVVAPQTALILSLSNALIHGAIDWHIWRGYKWWAHYRLKNGIDKHLYLNFEARGIETQWLYWEDHYFYATIGLDQLLHSLTIIGVCVWLS